MIFVTVGSAEPFDRVLRAVARLPAGEEIVVQCGRSQVRPNGSRCIPFMPFETVVAHMRRARAVVTHAGVGSVMTALANGKRPLVVPRLRRLGEAVDDHQLGFARRLSEDGLVVLVEDADELPGVVSSLRADAAGSLPTPSPLVDELRRYLEREIGSSAHQIGRQ